MHARQSKSEIAQTRRSEHTVPGTVAELPPSAHASSLGQRQRELCLYTRDSVFHTQPPMKHRRQWTLKIKQSADHHQGQHALEAYQGRLALGRLIAGQLASTWQPRVVT